MEAGLDESAAPLLELVPAVQVAWTDGSVPDPERAVIMKLAQGTAAANDPSSAALLASWLDTRPPDAFFAAAVAALRERLRALPAEQRIETVRRIAADAASVASASGGVLGFRATSDAESRSIQDLESALLSN
jgi:hypothetical protein